MLTHSISLSALIFSNSAAICQNIKIIISYAKLKRNMMLCPFFTNCKFLLSKNLEFTSKNPVIYPENLIFLSKYPIFSF